ncbi:MAG: hypothetical protein JWP98_777 [Edaphobacter sp.]|nr:hypothetical protein [Edaphobacter sp.]
MLVQAGCWDDDAGCWTLAFPNLHLYVHCLRNHPDGVALPALNADRTVSQETVAPIRWSATP